MDFQFKTSLKQILILVEYFQIEYQIVAAQEIWPQRDIVVVVGPEHVLRVPVLRNDRRGMGHGSERRGKCTSRLFTYRKGIGKGCAREPERVHLYTYLKSLAP